MYKCTCSYIDWPSAVYCLSIGKFIMPCPHRVGHSVLTAIVCLSVCLTLSQQRKGTGSWKMAERKPMTRVTQFTGRKVKGQGHLADQRCDRKSDIYIYISSEWEGLRTSKFVNRWSTMNCSTNLRSLGGCSSHRLQGRGHTVVAALYRRHSLFWLDFSIALCCFQLREVHRGFRKHSFRCFLLSSTSRRSIATSL